VQTVDLKIFTKVPIPSTSNMTEIATLFSRVQPVTIEMLDAKSSIVTHLTPRSLAKIEEEIYEMRRSARSIHVMKKTMGAFSTKEQNALLKDMRIRHAEIGGLLRWLVDR